MLLEFDRRLTADSGHAQAVDTHAGQAHFAGTGPADKTCRECRFWFSKPYLYYSSGHMKGQTLKPVACSKYKKMMGGREGARVPHHAKACRYFEPSSNPPPHHQR